MAEHIFTGFGFGPIQGGLFAKEAFESGNFARIVVAEIDSQLVDAVRANNGSYHVNVARSDGIEALKINNIELLNPNVEADKEVLAEVLAQSTEIVTSLPSVTFYETGGANSVASLIAEGLENHAARATIVYTAENNNHAAETLRGAVAQSVGDLGRKKVQFLNTVIGKMSRVVSDPVEIAELKLEPIEPGLDRAFLVEQFNRILVSRTRIDDFKPGIEVLVEKDDLLPFEEAKLYGHNAVHCVLGALGALRGHATMTQVGRDCDLMKNGRDAFVLESGEALVRKYSWLNDELFTQAGFTAYAEDLLERMTNPYLCDTIARVVRDLQRKLGIDGRIFGAMRLALEYGIEPQNLALGALAGIAVLLSSAHGGSLPRNLQSRDWRRLNGEAVEDILRRLWGDQTCESAAQLASLVSGERKRLEKLANA
jgi:mannitol-1-phosphate/altronate dehydrogenase